MTKKFIEPPWPGEILLEDFLKPLKISQYRLAKNIGVPPRRINEIVLNKRALTADTALRLAAYFNTTPQFWMNLQSAYELMRAERIAGKKLMNYLKKSAGTPSRERTPA